MLRFPLVVLLVASLCGCMTIAAPESFGIPEYVLLDHSSPEEVAALPPGGQIQISFDSPDGRVRRRITGTILKASPEGVALFNCVVERRHERGLAGAHSVPYVGRLFTNTGVGRSETPVLWVPLNEIGGVQVLAPPPEGYVPPNLPLDTHSGPIYEQLDAQGVPVSPIKGRATLD